MNPHLTHFEVKMQNTKTRRSLKLLKRKEKLSLGLNQIKTTY